MADPTGFISPDEITQRRQMAQRLMMQGTSAEPVQHWTQGLARVLQGGIGGMWQNSAAEGDRQNRTATTEALSASPEFSKLSPQERGLFAANPQLMNHVAGQVYGNKFDPMMGLKRQQIQSQINMSNAQIAQMRNQTPDARAAMAPKFGLQPGSEEYNQFVLSGAYAPKAPQLVHFKPGETAGVFKNGQFTPLQGQADGNQSAFDAKYATENAPKNYDESAKTYKDAVGTVHTASDLEALAKHASTGWGAESVLQLRKAAARFGLPASDAIAPTELFRMLTQKYVLTEGQKLKPMSNTDVQFVEKGLATIMSDPTSLPVVLPALKREAERTARAHQLSMEFYRRGRPADQVVIEALVDQEMPSIVRQMFSGGGQEQPGPAKPTPQVRTDADYDALPPGTRFVDPHGRVRVKR